MADRETEAWQRVGAQLPALAPAPTQKENGMSEASYIEMPVIQWMCGEQPTPYRAGGPICR